MIINYLILDILIILFPLLLSFKWKFAFYRYFKALFPAIAIVGAGYIIWDAIVTSRGDWWFNYEYLSGITIIGLPLEEILFFIVVPYSCIFIYENLAYFVPDKKIRFNKFFYVVLIVLFVISGLAFYHQDYTILALMSCAFFLLVALWRFPDILQSRNYWLYIGISMIPFIIFNYLLTSIPIVLYNPAAIWGGDGLWNGRFFTIPLEDFFYNYSMLSFYLMVYVFFKKRWISNKKDNSHR
ncbi:MAG: lycopene cyclase domain-containing protein [Candidatus Thermoplasmatota archaeon]|nr:lycopene cyclase domain-containing protein [Candidatus Thermoplasmatota archaeon]